MGHLYVLKLRGGKWYVGYTDRSTADRILEHIEEKGSQWTKMHPPLKKRYLHNFTTPNKTRKDEDNYTLNMMKKHGMDNVRGGQWAYPEFYPSTVKKLKRLIGKPKRKAKRKAKRKVKAKPKVKRQCWGFSTKRKRCTIKATSIPDEGYCGHHLYQAPPRHPQFQGDPNAYKPAMNDEGTLSKKQEATLRGHIYGHDGGKIDDRILLAFGFKSHQWRKRWLVDEPKRVPKPSGRIVTR